MSELPRTPSHYEVVEQIHQEGRDRLAAALDHADRAEAERDAAKAQLAELRDFKHFVQSLLPEICDATCPSKWKVSEKQPHGSVCTALRIALVCAMPKMTLEQAAEEMAGAEEVELSPEYIEETVKRVMETIAKHESRPLTPPTPDESEAE
jgi:hypothetical protein